jgi:hypothetical protein
MPFGHHPPVPKKEKISVEFLVRQIQKSVNIEIEPVSQWEIVMRDLLPNRNCTGPDWLSPAM